jgi:hypothetical protein
LLIAIALVTISASISSGKRYKNLKVLPQDISEKKLDSIMDAYCEALKVSCDFCHTKPKSDMFSFTPASDTIDFSSDNEMKENGRRMISLTKDINQKYFYFDSLVKPAYLNAVSCNTCHQGNPFPLKE